MRVRPSVWVLISFASIACGSPTPQWGVRDLDELALPTNPQTSPGSTPGRAVIAEDPRSNEVVDGDRDEDGVSDRIDRCPDEREDKSGDGDGCPDRDRALLGGVDTDGDSIGDAADLCPSDPEDKDGFQDSDGCPDPDNDRDGLLDATDACPNEAATTPTGCPTPGKR